MSGWVYTGNSNHQHVAGPKEKEKKVVLFWVGLLAFKNVVNKTMKGCPTPESTKKLFRHPSF